MKYGTLGRTGLRVSRVGLGCGGPSRLGQSAGQTVESSRAVVRRALELGINFFDTAQSYGTEEILGEALGSSPAGRDALVSTKRGVWDWASKRLLTATEMSCAIDDSLRRLRRERIDVFHLHGLAWEHAEYALSEMVPALEAARRAGKLRFLAVSEPFMKDTTHRMLQAVLPSQAFDVVMVGFNLLNPSARHSVFPRTSESNTGTLSMFAVRRALSRPERLREVLAEMVAGGQAPGELLRDEKPLSFLGDVRDAAYRFCVHEPGVDVVLTGTGSVGHLEQNVRSLLAPPLPEEILLRLEALFGRANGVSAH